MTLVRVMDELFCFPCWSSFCEGLDVLGISVWLEGMEVCVIDGHETRVGT